jgi:hypothetical protein
MTVCFLKQTTAMIIKSLIVFHAVIIACACNNHVQLLPGKNNETPVDIRFIREIPLAAGFKHYLGKDTVYASWLLNRKLKKENTVYHYNGIRKKNQEAQFAVLDAAIGKKDLLQCADAAIKLRADFLYQHKRWNEINFISTSCDTISYKDWLSGGRWKEQSGRLVATGNVAPSLNRNPVFESFMEFVYTYCGTYSLSRQLQAVPEIDSILPGDIFIQGGFPGHAVTVLSVIMNNKGEKWFLLVQGFMPAQDIHLLKNPGEKIVSPWYKIEKNKPIIIPEWVFQINDLKRWK